MRMIEIPLEKGYEQYKQIRNALFLYIPFAIVNCEFVSYDGPKYEDYDGIKTFGYFTFWDADYIPEDLLKYSVCPTGNNKLVEQVNNKIKEIFD